MKNLMIVVFISISLLGCKETEKKDDAGMQLGSDDKSIDMKDDKVDNLELGCYEYRTEGNDVKMEVTKIEGDAVTANLLYADAEKDKNEGTFFGNLHGDKLIGAYTFMSEGIESVREVAFKVEKDQIVEGFGELNDGGMIFKDTTKITYSSTTPWKKVDCN